MKNVGSKPFDPMWLESALVQRNDTEADEAYMMDTQPWWVDCLDAKLRPGTTPRSTCLDEVEQSSKLGRFQMTITDDNTFDEFTGEWDL